MSDSVVDSVRAAVKAKPGMLAKEVLAAVDTTDSQVTVSSLLHTEWKAGRMVRCQTSDGYRYATAGFMPPAERDQSPPATAAREAPAPRPGRTGVPNRPTPTPEFIVVTVDGGEVGVFHRESRVGMLLDKEAVAAIVAADRT